MKKFLIVFLLALSFDISAKSCEKKWAEYYAGKSWFEPWCDTAKYKENQRIVEELLYDDDGFNELEPRLYFSNPRYTVDKSCSTRNAVCINITGTFTNQSYQHRFSSVPLNCTIGYSIKNQYTEKNMHLMADLDSEPDSAFFTDYLQPQQEKYTQLYPRRNYLKKGKATFAKQRNAVNTLILSDTKSNDFKLNKVHCTYVTSVY